MHRGLSPARVRLRSARRRAAGRLFRIACGRGSGVLVGPEVPSVGFQVWSGCRTIASDHAGLAPCLPTSSGVRLYGRGGVHTLDKEPSNVGSRRGSARARHRPGAARCTRGGAPFFRSSGSRPECRAAAHSGAHAPAACNCHVHLLSALVVCICAGILSGISLENFREYCGFVTLDMRESGLWQVLLIGGGVAGRGIGLFHEVNGTRAERVMFCPSSPRPVQRRMPPSGEVDTPYFFRDCCGSPRLPQVITIPAIICCFPRRNTWEPA